MQAASAPATAAWSVLALLCGVTLVAQNPRDHRNLGPERFTSRTVVSGLGNPWDIAWGPDDHLWITERTGFRVIRVDPESGSTRVALVLDDVYQSVVQDGLLGLALHPDLLRGRGRDWVFVAYTYDRDPAPGVERRLRVRRYSYDVQTEMLTAPLDLIDNVPAHDDHGAGRLAVGPDGTLYVTRGDLGSNWLTNFCNPIRSQDLPTADQVAAKDWSTYQGKILRLNLDGSIPDDNPRWAGVRSHIYAIGMRNPQGLVFGPGGILYASDHGPSTDDELDVIEAGKNYGWPLVAGRKDDRAYSYGNWSASAPTPCAALKFDGIRPPPSVPQSKESAWNDPSFAAPIATFFTVSAEYDIARFGPATIAPAGIDVYAASAIPNWANSILITGMRAGGLYRVKLGPDGRSAVGEPLEYVRTANRYRDVVVSPDGRRIYLVTDSFGTTNDETGGRTSRLGHPGAVLEFTYAAQASSDAGQAAFDRVCKVCHGAAAQGDAGPRLVPFTREYEELLAIVREGTGQMPPIALRELPDEDVAGIVTYLKSLSP
jgi:PQQ-dependent dehydrogenase (s-GDH family)